MLVLGPKPVHGTALRRAGRSPLAVFALWSAIAIVAGAATMAGFVLFHDMPGRLAGSANALAAHAILAITGLITALGFLLAFALHQLA